MATLKINDINKNFGKTEVLKGINLDIGDGDFLVLLGPSGCGKSTFLRLFNRMNDYVDGFKMEGKINAITSMGKAQGWVVGMSPIGVGIMLYLQEPDIMIRLFTTWHGGIVTLIVFVMMVAAIFMIQKIVKIDI